MPFTIELGTEPATYSLWGGSKIIADGIPSILKYTTAPGMTTQQELGVGLAYDVNQPYISHFGSKLTGSNSTAPQVGVYPVPGTHALAQNGRFADPRTGIYSPSNFMTTGGAPDSSNWPCRAMLGKFYEVCRYTGFKRVTTPGYLPTMGWPSLVNWNATDLVFEIDWNYDAVLYLGFLTSVLYNQDTAFPITDVSSEFAATCPHPPTHVIFGANNYIAKPTDVDTAFSAPFVAGLPAAGLVTGDWITNNATIRDRATVGVAGGGGAPSRDSSGKVTGWTYALHPAPYTDGFSYYGDLCRNVDTYHMSTAGVPYVANSPQYSNNPGFGIATTYVPTIYATAQIVVCILRKGIQRYRDYTAPPYPVDPWPPYTPWPPGDTAPNLGWFIKTHDSTGAIITVASGSSAAVSYTFTQGNAVDYYWRYQVLESVSVSLSSCRAPLAKLWLEFDDASGQDGGWFGSADEEIIGIFSRNYPYMPGYGVAGPSTFIPGIVRKLP
jgi:hypothetical protein